MTENLLTRIQREMDERLAELRDAVNEHDRLAADLRVLDADPEPPDGSEPPTALEVVPEPPIDHELPANVVRLPERRPLSRTRMVSPKVARLMRTPRRPALERSGLVRVGAARLDSSPDELVDEVDAEAEIHERSL